MPLVEVFSALRVQLAPLAEQERIVAAIEEQFSRLDAGRGGCWNGSDDKADRLLASLLASCWAS